MFYEPNPVNVFLADEFIFRDIKNKKNKMSPEQRRILHSGIPTGYVKKADRKKKKEKRLSTDYKLEDFFSDLDKKKTDTNEQHYLKQRVSMFFNPDTDDIIMDDQQQKSKKDGNDKKDKKKKKDKNGKKDKKNKKSKTKKNNLEKSKKKKEKNKQTNDNDDSNTINLISDSDEDDQKENEETEIKLNGIILNNLSEHQLCALQYVE